jgi:hypothetical protein
MAKVATCSQTSCAGGRLCVSVGCSQIWSLGHNDISSCIGSRGQRSQSNASLPSSVASSWFIVARFRSLSVISTISPGIDVDEPDVASLREPTYALNNRSGFKQNWRPRVRFKKTKLLIIFCTPFDHVVAGYFLNSKSHPTIHTFSHKRKLMPAEAPPCHQK